ncbi:c-type cytochrome [bacterium]|nr:c-type cytochrome [bacterium]
MGKTTNKLLDHDFDGIQEYDNDLPGWWKALFLITIIFSVGYISYYHLFGDLQDTEYQKEMGIYTENNAERGTMTPYSSPYADDGASSSEAIESTEVAAAEDAIATASDVPDETLAQNLAALTDETSLAAGKVVWDTMCFTCHLNDGGGSIGPNMTDNYWIHGGDLASMINVINVGVPAKGMIPWAGTLSPDQILQVASYIKVKLVGSTPASPKDPEGELFEG